jgi:hypothetical protein
MESVFKVGDRVYHFQHGWGTVKKADGIMSVIFTHGIVTFIEGRLLSFTEYTLQGFSQERPVELPKVGELCLVRDYNDESWLVREFAEYRHGLFICQSVHGQCEVEWKYMKRIKILD